MAIYNFYKISKQAVVLQFSWKAIKGIIKNLKAEYEYYLKK